MGVEVVIERLQWGVGEAQGNYEAYAKWLEDNRDALDRQMCADDIASSIHMDLCMLFGSCTRTQEQLYESALADPKFETKFQKWKHRRARWHKRNALRLAREQVKSKPHYFVGDIVRTRKGGVGIISVAKVTQGVPGYAIDKIKGHKEPPYHAWFHECDIKKLIAQSPLRNLKAA